jgi:hypothetical protein
MNAKTIIFFLALCILTFVIFSCEEEPPVVPPPPPAIVKDTLTLTLEYSTHRSIILNSKTTTNNKNSTIELYRQINNIDTLVANYPITNNDTSIIDDNSGKGLELNTTYTYYAVRVDTTGARKDSSNFITTTTLAATNFNYTWQEFAIGSLLYGPNILYDVWGNDEANVWAVGGFYDDNNKNYGALHYDGNQWTPDSTVGGYAIYGFGWNDIWVVGGGVFHFDGIEWKQKDSYLSGVQRIPLDIVLFNNLPYFSVWGSSSNDLFLGNSNGKIIHWNGSNAQMVYNNPDDVFVNDLDGYSSDFIIGVGTGMVPPLLAIKYDGTNWADLLISNNWSLNAVAIVTKNHIFFAGGGIFEMKGTNFSRIINSGYYVWDIEYNSQTGVTVGSGSYDGIYINNGLEWRSYQGQISNDETTYSGILIINSSIFCVGRNDNQAKILIGKSANN